MLTFEQEQFMGSEGILGKLGGLPPIKHTIATVDYQPSVNNGIVCFVLGTMLLEGQENAIPFAQVFHLQVGGTQGYYVHNDLFRMNIG